MAEKAVIRLTETVQKQLVFIQSLAQFDNVAEACRVSGINRTWAYEMRKEDQWFANAWDEAKQTYLDNYEASGRMFALEQKDHLGMLRYLKHKHPEYKEPKAPRQVQQNGKLVDVEVNEAGEPTETEKDYDLSLLTIAERTTLLDLMDKCGA